MADRADPSASPYRGSVDQPAPLVVSDLAFAPWTFRRFVSEGGGPVAAVLLVTGVLLAPIWLTLPFVASGGATMGAMLVFVLLGSLRTSAVIDRADRQTRKALSRYEEGDDDAALAALADVARALTREPTPYRHARAVFVLARTMKLCGRLAPARALFESLTQNEWVTYLDGETMKSRVAEIAIYQGDIEGAQRWLDAARIDSLAPKPTVLRFLECSLCARERRYSECIADLEAAWAEMLARTGPDEMNVRVLLKAFAMHELAGGPTAEIDALVASARPVLRDQVAAARAEWREFDAFCLRYALPD